MFQVSVGTKSVGYTKSQEHNRISIIINLIISNLLVYLLILLSNPIMNQPL